MRPSYIGTLIAGVVAGIVGAVLALYVLFNHSGKYAWFYWIAPLLVIGFLLVMVELVHPVLAEGRAARDEGSPTQVMPADTDGTEVRAPDPVDWATARRVARFVARHDPLADSYLAASLKSDFDEVTVQAEALVASYTGLRAPGTATARVLGRHDWVDSNLRSMRTMLDPLMQKFGERLAHNPIAPVSRRIAAGELGALLGYMSQRVLGQYDLLWSPTTRRGDAVYYVGVEHPRARKAIRVPARATSGSGSRSTRSRTGPSSPACRGCASTSSAWCARRSTWSTPTRKAFMQAVSRALDEVRAGRNPLDEGGVVGLFASTEQRGVLAQVQSLMSVLEGHGNVVMDDLGRDHVAGQERMSRVLQQRRQAGGLTSMMHKLLGFEQKMRQYEIGEKFVRGVIAAGGAHAIDAVWQSPDHLPTTIELDAPEQWLSRVGPARAAGLSG